MPQSKVMEYLEREGGEALTELIGIYGLPAVRSAARNKRVYAWELGDGTQGIGIGREPHHAIPKRDIDWERAQREAEDWAARGGGFGGRDTDITGGL